MSLIQAALNKAGSSPKQMGEVPSPEAVRKIKEPSNGFRACPQVMDEKLERKLREVQHRYGSRRALGWKIMAGVFVLSSLIVLGAILQYFPSSGSPELTEGGFSENFNPGIPGDVKNLNGNNSAGFSALAKGMQAKSHKDLSYPSRQTLRLTGILDLGGGARAVINDRILAVGDSAGDGWVVMEIDPDTVTLESCGEISRLKL